MDTGALQATVHGVAKSWTTEQLTPLQRVSGTENKVRVDKKNSTSCISKQRSSDFRFGSQIKEVGFSSKCSLKQLNMSSRVNLPFYVLKYLFHLLGREQIEKMYVQNYRVEERVDMSLGNF